MRMRKKKNLEPRLDAVAERFAETPEELREHIGLKPVWLELGCGMGRFAAQTARERPDIFVVGFERVREAVVVAAERAETENVAFVCRDADELEAWFGRRSVERLFIQFCDPWHKARHAKRRLTHRTFLGRYAGILCESGELVVKTDNAPLFEFTLEELDAAGWEVTLLSRDWHNDPNRGANEPETEYESKFSARGQTIFRLSAKPKV